MAYNDLVLFKKIAWMQEYEIWYYKSLYGEALYVAIFKVPYPRVKLDHITMTPLSVHPFVRPSVFLSVTLIIEEF